MADYPRNPFPVPPLQGMPHAPKTLHECLAFVLSPDAVEVFIKEHPDQLNEKGFNGQSPLHKACMVSNAEIVEIMLRHGADANARNNFEETPLHFACKRGNPQMVHSLIQYGADISATDRAGKGAILHTAHGGATYNFCYLSEVHGLSFDVIDSNLQSPLHIVCEHGHVDAFMYLMRKERSNVHQRDRLGNTPLHIAAKGGHATHIWKMAQSGGYKLLMELNNEGYSPLDLARQGTHFRHQQAVRLLTSYSMPYYRTHKIVGPTLVWYWLASAPTLLYLLALLATHMLGQAVGNQGFLMMLGFAGILVVCSKQWHRMKHVCRWPNPMYAGMFGAGLVHTALCYLVEVLPVVYSEQLFLTLVSLLLTVVIFTMYYSLMIGDPGKLTQPRAKEHTGDFYTIADIAAQRLPPATYCTACELVVLPQTKHCKLCETCYVNMDHHCLFLYKCIARNNHRQFIRFICLVLVAMLLFELQGYLYLLVQYPNSTGLGDLVVNIFNTCPWVWSAMFANAGSICWGVCLLRFQMSVISRGHTSYFQAAVTKSKLNIFQRIRNSVNFLLGRKLYAVETAEGIQIL